MTNNSSKNLKIKLILVLWLYYRYHQESSPGYWEEREERFSKIKSYCKCEDPAGGSFEIISWCSGLLWLDYNHETGRKWEERRGLLFIIYLRRTVRELLVTAQETLEVLMNDDSWWIYLIIALSQVSSQLPGSPVPGNFFILLRTIPHSQSCVVEGLEDIRRILWFLWK